MRLRAAAAASQFWLDSAQMVESKRRRDAQSLAEPAPAAVVAPVVLDRGPVDEEEVRLDDLEALEALAPHTVRQAQRVVVQRLDAVVQLGDVGRAQVGERRAEEGRRVAQELGGVELGREVEEEGAQVREVAAYELRVSRGRAARREEEDALVDDALELGRVDDAEQDRVVRRVGVRAQLVQACERQSKSQRKPSRRGSESERRTHRSQSTPRPRRPAPACPWARTSCRSPPRCSRSP